MKHIELDSNNFQDVLEHLEDHHDLASDPEWSIQALEDVGGPAEYDLHCWYHLSGHFAGGKHSHGQPFESWLKDWHL